MSARGSALHTYAPNFPFPTFLPPTTGDELDGGFVESLPSELITRRKIYIISMKSDHFG